MAEKELEKIVGSKNVLDNAEVIGEHSGDFSFTPRMRPRCIVRPGNAGEVQKLVKWANETRGQLVPVSSGAPHFRGGAVPATGGTVVTDLSRMNKIIRSDRRNRVTMIEPGVTCSELIPKLKKEGLRLNLPLLPRSTKSVIGSMLEREPVIMPLYQWDALDPLTCIEVIFGTGDLFRTGSSAGPGSLEEQWAAKQAQVNPMGPGQTDFARVVQGAQGTMGIVTWATVRCEFVPEIQKPFLAGSDNIERLTELVYRLMHLKVGDECLLLNNSCLAAIYSKNPDEYADLMKTLPPWLLFLCLAGYEYFPEDRIAYQEKEMRDAASAVEVEPTQDVAGVPAEELLKIMGKPSEEPYWKLRQKGAFQDIFFLTTLDRVPGFIDIMKETAAKYEYPPNDIGTYIQPMVQGTSCHCEFNMYYHPSDAVETARVRELSVRAAEALMNAGAFFSRPYGNVADMVYRRDGETAAALKKVKSIFDPNGVMNPGKLCF